MIELEEQSGLKPNQEIPVNGETTAGKIRQIKTDPLLLAIIGTGFALMIIVLGIAYYWGSGPVLVAMPWYIPLISAFAALTTLSISYLALARYQVMRDSLSFWAGSGFAIYGIGQIFYALTWPGLLPGGGSILGHLISTSAVIELVDLTLLNGFLLAAVLMRWPGKQDLAGGSWLWWLMTWLVLVTVGFGLLVRFESYLPQFVTDDGRFTMALRIWVAIQLCAYSFGSVLSALYYRHTGERFAAYIAFPQIALVFISMMVLIGGKRYDLWWYVQRVVLVGGYLSVFFGLLSEYIRLLQRESEGRHLLEAILENIPIGLAVTNGPPHFSIARVSRHGLEMNQRSPEKLVGLPSGTNQTAWKIFLPNEATQPAPEQMPLFRASQFGEEIRNAEFEMEAQDGRRVPVLVSASPIRDTQGNIVAAINAWLDITDRKRAEEVLLESEALYRAIARSIPSGGIFVVDRNLRYIIADGSVLESYGYSREMLEGHAIAEVLDAESAARMQARLQRVFSGETLSYEAEHNGHIYWTQYALMKESLGYAIIITLDITERKQVERALSESEQRLRAIVNQATAGIVSTTRDGRTILVNQAFCRMLGFEESELIGKTIWQLLHGDDVEETRRLFNRLVEKAAPFQIEGRFVRRDESILWANVSASPILDAVGKPESSVAVIVDVSESKQAEAALQKLNLELESRVEQRTTELQIANRALTEGRQRLQILSQRLVEVQEDERRALARELHDRVGQTLTALNLNLTIVSDQLSNQPLPPVSSRLSDSIKLVTEMISIVRDVMSDLRPVVLDEYGLEAALNTYVSKFAARYGIRVEFTRSNLPVPSLGAAMEMTVLRIVQEALLNIARHAQADHVLVSMQCKENALFLTIQDNGVGILSFQQAKQSRGHGLMIMQERAEAVGGTLGVSSTPGDGTKIEAILPFQPDSGENSVEERK